MDDAAESGLLRSPRSRLRAILLSSTPTVPGQSEDCVTLENPFQGQLFADGFLCEAIAASEDWQAFDGIALETLRADLHALISETLNGRELGDGGEAEIVATETELLTAGYHFPFRRQFRQVSSLAKGKSIA